jgi:hypothetical protein
LLATPRNYSRSTGRSRRRTSFSGWVDRRGRGNADCPPSSRAGSKARPPLSPELIFNSFCPASPTLKFINGAPSPPPHSRRATRRPFLASGGIRSVEARGEGVCLGQSIIKVRNLSEMFYKRIRRTPTN